MKKITRIIVFFFALAGFSMLQAQDFTDLTMDPFSTGSTGGGAYSGSSSLSGGDFDLSLQSGNGSLAQGTTTPTSGISTAAFRQEGIASWYGTEFEGHPTASGEIFNPAQLSAAHPTLPFGTLLRVTNTQNNRQVTVRVNDRGPFVNTRIIDVSRAAAEVLDMVSTGTAPVIVELAGEPVLTSSPTPPIISEPWIAPIPPLSPPFPQSVTALPPASTAVPEQAAQPSLALDPNAAAVKPGLPPPGTGKLYRIQVGAYRVTRNAVDTFDRVKSLGLEPSYERYGDFYRVVIDKVSAEEIPALAGKLGSAGFREILVREE